MNVQTEYISYGSDSLPLFLPEHTKKLQVNDPEKVITPELFTDRLQSFFDSNPLDLTAPVLVVADKTRLCGYPEYLPILIQELTQRGMDPKALKIIIAYGTHPPQSREECLRAYGEVYDGYTFLHHDAKDKNLFRDVGTTAKGTPIRLRKDILDASAVITMGAVTHHYFAGYGGGRKLIFPGCGEREAIYANHSLFLDKEQGILAPGCQPGNLTNNPLADDLFEVEEKLPAHLAIHGLLNSHGELCDLFVGNKKETFLDACRAQGKSCEVEALQFDTAIASCGGFPKDINFIQTHKAVHNAAMFVKDGGLLLLYCECRDSIGSVTFLPWFEKGSFEKAFEVLSKNYEGNGGTALAMMTKTKRIRIGLVTTLTKELLDTIGAEQWNHSGVCDYIADLKEDHSLAFIPNASLLVKKQ